MITVNLYYTGKNGSARAFAAEMESTGIADEIRKEPGNLRYQYFSPLDDPETVLLIDSWTDQAAIDVHHASPMMLKIMELREKYDLHMTAERFISEEMGSDEKFIRKGAKRITQAGIPGTVVQNILKDVVTAMCIVRMKHTAVRFRRSNAAKH